MVPYRFMTVCLIAIVLVGCSQAASTVGEPTGFANACDEDNKGQRIAVEGFLRLPDSFTGEESVVLRLYETNAFDGTPVGVQTRFGTEANQLEMVPVQYSDSDLQVYLADGQNIGYGTKVKVSGKVYFPLVDQDFVCGLENPLIELAN